MVYSIPVYSGALIKMPIMISGSGSTYVVGFCDANFRSPTPAAAVQGTLAEPFVFRGNFLPTLGAVADADCTCAQRGHHD